MRHLHTRGPRARGLVVDADGVMLGPDCQLVTRTAAGYSAATQAQLTWLLRTTFPDDRRLDRLAPVLGYIIAALNAGDVVRAQLLGLEIPFDELDGHQLRRLRFASDLLKAGFNPNQLRDRRGRWASEAAASDNYLLPVSATVAAADAAAATGALAREMGPFWERAAGVLATAGDFGVTLFGACLVTFSNPNVSIGTLPGSSDLFYHYDEGKLSIFHKDADGNTATIFEGRAGADGLYRDDAGHIVARQLTNDVGFVLEPGSLGELAAKAQPKWQEHVDPAKVLAAVHAYSKAIADTDVKLCPNPSPESGGPNSLRSAMYQWQVCGMPPGWSVKIGGVGFDGCDPVTGRLFECKGPGLVHLFPGSPDDPSTWPKWATLDKKKGLLAILDQMRRQSAAAAGREVHWYVAEKSVAVWLARFAERYPNIHVHQLDPPPYDPDKLKRFAADVRTREREIAT
jgi:hypothetical protein